MHVYETKWFGICCVNEDMDRNWYKSSLFILVLKGIKESERFSYMWRFDKVVTTSL